MSQATRADSTQRTGPPPRWASIDEAPSVRAGIRQALGAALTNTANRVLEGRSSRIGRHVHTPGQQYGDTERSGQYPWSQQRTQRGSRQAGPWQAQLDLDQVDFVGQFDGMSNPWRTDISQRPEFPSTMTGSAKGIIMQGLDDEVIVKLAGYCPGAAVALLDWFVMHRSQTVLAMARSRLTRLLQTISAGQQAIASAKLGVQEARVLHDEQLTAAVGRLGVRYIELRDTTRFLELDELRQAASVLSTTLDSRQHIGRQVSACIIEAVTELALGNAPVADAKMARALTLVGEQFGTKLFTDIARQVNPTIVEQTLNDVDSYSDPQRRQSQQDQPTESRPYAMAGVGQSRDMPGQQRRPGDDQEPPL